MRNLACKECTAGQKRTDQVASLNEIHGGFRGQKSRGSCMAYSGRQLLSTRGNPLQRSCCWTDRATRRKPLSSHQVVRTGQSEAYVTLRSLRSLLSGNCGHTISMPLILTVRSHEASRYAKFSPPSAGYFFAQRWGGCLPSADWGAMRWGQPCHRVGAP